MAALLSPSSGTFAINMKLPCLNTPFGIVTVSPPMTVFILYDKLIKNE